MNSARKVSLREERSRAGQGPQVVRFPRPAVVPAVRPSRWGRVLELGAAVAVNAAIATVAVAALARLIPYHQQEQERLRELSLEMREASERVEGLRRTLADTMDARQSGRATERREGWLGPGQVLVLPVEETPSSAVAGETAIARRSADPSSTEP
ncbi:MAG: hypothetical protein HC918_07910 [Oscillatoriales cyanobacterium SM2_1_8]|nr:hypothetical protein [Oscillatoriales cyanobacterium SM2_1_8]